MIQPPSSTIGPAEAITNTGLASTGNRTRLELLGGLGAVAAGIILLVAARMFRKAGH
jgi:hypothetical protein